MYRFDILQSGVAHLVNTCYVSVFHSGGKITVIDETDKSQLDKLKEATRELETDDDPDRFKEHVGKLVKHSPLGKPIG